MRKTTLPFIAVLVLAAILYFAVMFVLIFNAQPQLMSSTNSNKTPTINIALFEGEISPTKYGFGNSSTLLTSPGPTIRFKLSDIVNITVVNVGMMPHAFEITNEPKTGSTMLFDAQIGQSSYLEPGQKGTIIFTPTKAGSFYYICPVPGHPELGMYGSVVITG